VTLAAIQVARDQAQIARDEFLASHTPELVIHSVRLLDPQGVTDNLLSAQFGIINAGTSGGMVVGSAVHLEYWSPHDLPPLYGLVRNDVIPARRFNVGASDTITVSSPTIRSRGQHNIAATGREMYLAGWVAYKDGREHTRTTFFCRQYRRDLMGRFVRVDDPDCEQTY
jgi:hypothetical protein